MEDKALIAKSDLKTLLATESIEQRFKKVLGANADAYMTALLNAAVSNPEIMAADPISVINSALQAAVLGLSISPALGQAAIVPYNTREGKKSQLIIMKNGIVQMALRTNQYRYIHVGKIYEGEIWEEDRLTGKVTFRGGRKGSKIVGYVAYFQLLSGFEKYLLMTIDEIMDHAKKYSKSYDKAGNRFYPGSAWADNFERMCEKTVLKLLIKNYGVMSDKMQQVFELENETGEHPVMNDAEPGETTLSTVAEPDPDHAKGVLDDDKRRRTLFELGYN